MDTIYNTIKRSCITHQIMAAKSAVYATRYFESGHFKRAIQFQRLAFYHYAMAWERLARLIWG